MFRSIVSNLSLSPSATTQLTFYYRRLKGEQITRQLSIMMAVVLACLQVATIIAPPDPATAASTNDIIRGGIKTDHPQRTLLHYYNNDPEIKAIFNHYGIDHNDIERTKHGTANSKNHKLLSLGRNPHSSKDQRQVINGRVYYLRPLYTWGDNITYGVLEGRRAVDGKYFAIMYNCGNLIVTDATPDVAQGTISNPQPLPARPTPKPTPSPTPIKTVPNPSPIKTVPTPSPIKTLPQEKPTPAPTPTPTPPPIVNLSPNLTLKKTGVLTRLDGTTLDANGATAQPGETIEYTLTTTNTGTGDEKDYVVTDNVQDILEYADIIDTRNGVLSGGNLSWNATTIKLGESLVTSFVVKVKSPLPAAPRAVSDPQSFDLVIDNIYAKSLVRTNLTAPTAAKQVEVASANLPQTGSGTSTLIVFGLIGLIAFFYFRNRQMIYELSILRNDHHGGSYE